MPLTIINNDAHTTTVVNHLGGAGFAIGDGEAPESPSPDFPYAVVYRLPGSTDGPMNDQDADVELTYQVTSVGVRRDQAEWLQWKLRDRFLNTAFAVVGRSISEVRILVDGPTERDDDARTGDGQSLFYSIDIFAFWSTPV